jgi:hypothetical protein
MSVSRRRAGELSNAVELFPLRPVTHTANVECPDSDVCMPLQHALVQRPNQRDISDYML